MPYQELDEMLAVFRSEVTVQMLQHYYNFHTVDYSTLTYIGGCNFVD